MGFSTLASAQPADFAPLPRLRFLFLDESAGAYSVKVGRDQRQLSSGPYVISPPFTPADLKPLVLFKELSDPATGLVAPIEVARVSVPTDSTSALVIVSPRPRPAATSPLAYAVEIVPTSAEEFPAGSVGIVNRAQAAVATKFGDVQAAVAPGEVKILRVTPDHRHRVLSRIAGQTSEGWKLVSDSISVVRPEERLIGIYVHSPSGMRHMFTAEEIAEFGPPQPGNFWLTFSDRP